MPDIELERSWQAHGLDCAVVFVELGATWPGHRCGYVRVPKDHPLDRSDYDEAGLDAHGGLTFSGELKVPDTPAGWWFGFDCAHAGDSPSRWTTEAVEREVERMAEQLVRASVV